MKTKSTLLTALPAITLLIFFLPAIFTTGCKGKTPVDEAFFFTPIDPIADSLLREYELHTRGIVDSETGIDTIWAQLDSIARVTGNRQLKARSLYVKSSLYDRAGDKDAYVNALDSAIAITDSAKYPYDHACMTIDKAYDIGNSWTEVYRRLQDPLVIFKEVNDSFRVSHVYNFIGAINHVFDDDNGAIKNYELAVEWLPSRYDFQKFIGYFNITISLYQQGKTSEWYPRVDSMKRSRFLDEGERFNTVTMILSYKKSGNVADLYNAYSSACRPIDPEWAKPYVLSLLADYYLKAGDRDSMIHYARMMRGLITPAVERFGYYCDILEINGRLYEAEGKTDSAKMANMELAHLKDKNNALHDAVMVQNELQKKEFAEIDRTIAEEREREATWRRVTAVAAAIAVAACVWFIVAWQRRRHRRECMMLESTLEQKERRIAAAEMRASEKDRALAEIAGDVRDIKSDDPEVVARIMSTINVNRFGDADWEKFSLLFGEMHPDFADSLRREYPALTTGDVNLACMVFLGLETKHIARLLSINPDSVKKNRQRLRAKLGLTPDQPLDLFLRDYERNRRNCHR